MKWVNIREIWYNVLASKGALGCLFALPWKRLAMHPAARLPFVWRTGILILALLVAAASASAAERVPYGQGILWKIEQPGAAPNYLLGTMHVNDPRVRNLPAPVRAAFNRAERAVFEIVITPDVRRQVSEMRFLPEGRSLDEILGPQLFDELAARAEAAGMSRDTLRRLKPWAAAMALQPRQANFSRAFRDDLPLDQWMQSNARSRSVPLLELETVQEQLSAYDDMAEADQIAMLRDGLAEARQSDVSVETMTLRYVARDIGAIFHEFQENIDATSGTYARVFATRFIDDRNRTMVKRMQDLLRQGGTFVAVGALHLPGDQGILRLLQRQGFSIIRVY